MKTVMVEIEDGSLGVTADVEVTVELEAFICSYWTTEPDRPKVRLSEAQRNGIKAQAITHVLVNPGLFGPPDVGVF